MARSAAELEAFHLRRQAVLLRVRAGEPIADIAHELGVSVARVLNIVKRAKLDESAEERRSDRELIAQAAKRVFRR